MLLQGTSRPACVGLVGRRHSRRALQALAAKKDSSPWGSTGGAKRGSGGSGSGPGSGGGSSGKANKGGSTPSGGSSGSGSKDNGSSPWKDTPARTGLPGRGNGSLGNGAKGAASKGAGAGGRPAAAAGFAGAGAAAAGSRLGGRNSKPETTITDPIEVTLLDELSKTENAAEPKWGTFCSHLNGEWVGQYAAYTPWAGTPEPAWVDERGKYINVVYTRALEHRYVYGGGSAGAEGQAPEEAGEGTDSGSEGGDVLLRKIGRCTKMSGLADLVLVPEGGFPAQQQQQGQEQQQQPLAPHGQDQDSADDVDVEALAFNTDGIVVFDGGNYSAGPEYIGHQSVKLVNDEPLGSDGEGAGAASDGDRAASGTAASTSGREAGAAGPGPAPKGGRGAAKQQVVEEDEEDDIGEDEDEDGSTVTPTTTSVFEQCLVDWGRKLRVRVKMTLRIGQLPSGEVDVEVLRILLFQEQWVAAADSGAATGGRLAVPLETVKALQGPPATAQPRPTPQQLQGSWNVFTVCATALDEADPFTGEERVVWLYTSNEEQQLWDANDSPPQGDAGGAYWLPGGVVLSLKMVDNYVPVDQVDQEDGTASDGSGSDSDSRRSSNRASGSSNNGNGSGAEAEREYPRGLCLGMAWHWQDGAVSQIEREYDGYGYLREVRLASAVKGGWSGGRM